MKPKVYIETSIPSFYHEIRTEPDMQARKQWTRQWWDYAREDYSLVTSIAVLDELNRGEYPNKQKVLEFTESMLHYPSKVWHHRASTDICGKPCRYGYRLQRMPLLDSILYQ